MSVPDVSVLIPAYNAASTLERAVKSAITQAGVNVEACICNDGSTDTTGGILAHLEFLYPNVHVIGQRNGGVASAMNASASLATGRYMIECDSDDWLAPNSLAALVGALDMSGVGFAYGCTQFHGMYSFRYAPPPFRVEDFTMTNASMYAVMYKREAWDLGCRYRDYGNTLQDWDFILQMIYDLRYTAAVISGVVLHHDYHVGGLHELHSADTLAAFKRAWSQVRTEKL